MQEVVGDERSALQAVVAADAELMELREEEEQLNKQLQEASLEDKPKGFDADEASERLNEVTPLVVHHCTGSHVLQYRHHNVCTV